MRKLIILSDLWGLESCDWMQIYIDNLSPYYELIVYDSRVLGEIDKSAVTERSIHQQFLNSGVNIAVNKFLLLEKEKADLLAFSMGGCIAWKAMLSGMKIEKLTALSATRVRYEKERPESIIELHFGEMDPFIPGDVWFEEMKIQKRLYLGKNHDFYTEKDIATKLSKNLIELSKLH